MLKEVSMEKCNQKTEVYARCVGYFRPIEQWNLGKQSEYKVRTPFKVTQDFNTTKIKEDKKEE